jgi:hypothetical protein
MPRFFFDIHDGEAFTPDRVGLDLLIFTEILQPRDLRAQRSGR